MLNFQNNVCKATFTSIDSVDTIKSKTHPRCGFDLCTNLISANSRLSPVISTVYSYCKYFFYLHTYIHTYIQCKKFKLFLLSTVYRPPDASIDFLEDLSKTFVVSLLHGLNVIILGDLNCNVLGRDPDGCALIDFCSTFGLSQLAKTQRNLNHSLMLL